MVAAELAPSSMAVVAIICSAFAAEGSLRYADIVSTVTECSVAELMQPDQWE
jgi:hypothetical protein